jgi:DNA-binding protein
LRKDEPTPSSDTSSNVQTSEERNIIFIGTKPIMTYVSATLTQLSTRPTITIKARGKRITQAVDVSQMIIKRMDTVGYVISDVRISSDSLTSQDGKQRNVSNMEIDLKKE